MTTLNTRPEPVEVDFKRSAIVVVDMQNAFATKGGLLDLAGVDISGAAASGSHAGRRVESCERQRYSGCIPADRLQAGPE